MVTKVNNNDSKLYLALLTRRGKTLFATFHSWLKAGANGFNICFNMRSILLNGNVEAVCHPLSTMLNRVETC